MDFSNIFIKSEFLISSPTKSFITNNPISILLKLFTLSKALLSSLVIFLGKNNEPSFEIP